MQIELIIERLVECRQELGLTQTEAAKLIGVSQPAYQRYEAGVRTPSVQVAREIANAFHTSVDYLAGNSKEKHPDYIVVDEKETPLLFSVVDQCKSLDEEQLKRLLDYFKNIQGKKSYDNTSDTTDL